MDSQDLQTEAKLKARFAQLAPTRSFFDATLARVTKPVPVRYTSVKTVVPSPYQFTHPNKSIRTYLFGIPVALVAIAAVVIWSQQSTTSAPVAQVSSTSATEQTNASVATAALNASIDSVVDAIVADANSEVDTNDDEIALNTELDNYNSLQTYDVIL